MLLVTGSILADVNGDNQVDILDLAFAARSYNLDEKSSNANIAQ